MGTRHWPDDAHDELERLERKIAELEADVRFNERVSDIKSKTIAKLQAQVARTISRSALAKVKGE